MNGNVDVVGELNLITKLSPSLIGNGDVSSIQLSYLNTLNNILQTQFNSVVGNISSLQSLGISHSSLISSLQSFQTNQETYNQTNDTNISNLQSFQTDQEEYNLLNDVNM